MTASHPDRSRSGPFLLHLSRRTQWTVIITLQLLITVVHNAIPIPTAALVMVLTQKLFFVPIILAGFWLGVWGGLASALLAAVFYPHYAMSHAHHGGPALDVNMASDMVLLFLVGGITGWLRNLLDQELKRHQATAERLDQALAEVTRTYERAARAERLAALGQMAAGIAHEVRNPLTSMQGAVDILQRSLTTQPERATTLLARLQSEIAHLEGITRHVLEFARPPGTTMRTLAPAELVQESVEALATQARQHNLRLRFDAEPTEHTILGDRDQLRQVIVNLVLNAIQFADPDSEIAISSHFEDGEWRFCVANHGPGIAPENCERIFEPFFTTRADGTGLGLSIAARIAEAHDGTLRCESQDGATRFTLSIPESRA